MKILKRIMIFFKLRSAFAPAVFGCLFFASFQPANAQIATFGQFFERTGSQDFIFTNNTSNAVFNTVNGGSAIYFQYQNINGLNASLTGLQNAHLFLNSGTSSTATASGNILTQTFNNSVNTIQILRDTPASVGSGSRTNLLTVTFSPVGGTAPSFAGTNGGNSSSFSATTPDHTVTFTSDFLNFFSTVNRNFALSFSSVSPGLTIGNGGVLRSFAAAGSGTFSSDPAPIVGIVTAASVTVGGRVLNVKGRGLSNAQVIVTQADGSMRTTLTDNFGRYSFEDLAIPQTVIISVISKTCQFNSQVVALDSDFSEMNFAPGN